MVVVLTLLIAIVFFSETILSREPRPERKRTAHPNILLIHPTDPVTEAISIINNSNNNSYSTDELMLIANNTTSNSNITYNKPYRWETQLLHDLFTKNNDLVAEIRPARRKTEPVVVTIEFVVRQISDLKEKDQQIALSGFLKITWIDDRFTWTKDSYGGIEWVVIPAYNLWLPDIALVNSNNLYSLTRDERFPVTVTSDGEMFYVPAGKLFVRCNFNLRFFPFDYQLCVYRFESWVYSAELVTVVGTNFTIDYEHYLENPQWEIRLKLVKTSIVKYESFNFSRVEFYLLLRRQSIFFVAYTIFPCMALSTLQICSHMLPFTESERLNFATTTLIAYSVFHVSIVEQLPQSSDAIPLLAVYIDGLMCLIGLSLIECFLMMNWLAKVGCSVPSPFFWQAIVERFGPFVFLGSNGRYWRRHYLRIFLEVQQKRAEDLLAKQKEVEKWSKANQREKITRKFSKFSLKRCSSRISGGLDGTHGGNGDVVHDDGYEKVPNKGDVEAIMKIGKRWGWNKGGDMTSIPYDLKAAGDTFERSTTKASETAYGGSDLDHFGSMTSLCVGRLPSNIPFSPAEEDTDNGFNCYASGNPSPSLSGASSLHSYCSEPASWYDAVKRVSQLGVKSNEHDDFVKQQAEWAKTERQLEKALFFLKKLSTNVKSSLVVHALRRDCVGIWTTFITVIDRLISFTLLVTCALLPFCLFTVFPYITGKNLGISVGVSLPYCRKHLPFYC